MRASGLSTGPVRRRPGLEGGTHAQDKERRHGLDVERLGHVGLLLGLDLEEQHSRVLGGQRRDHLGGEGERRTPCGRGVSERLGRGRRMVARDDATLERLPSTSSPQAGRRFKQRRRARPAYGCHRTSLRRRQSGRSLARSSRRPSPSRPNLTDVAPPLEPTSSPARPASPARTPEEQQARTHLVHALADVGPGCPEVEDRDAAEVGRQELLEVLGRGDGDEAEGRRQRGGSRDRAVAKGSELGGQRGSQQAGSRWQRRDALVGHGGQGREGSEGVEGRVECG